MHLKQTIISRLKSLEKYTKTDMVYLTTGSFWLTTNQVVSAAFTFGLAVALAHILPTEAFGNYRYVLSLAAVASAFSLTGLNLAVIKNVAKGVHGLLRTSFITQLKWSVGTFIASLVISGYYFLQNNNDLAISTFVMGLFLPVIASARIYSSFWEGKKNYKKIAIFDLITTIIYVGFLFITIHLTSYIPILVFMYFGTQAACAYLFYRMSLKYDTGVKDSPEETLNFGKHVSFLNVLSILAGQLDRILVFHYLGATQLAIYALSQIPVGYARTLLKPVVQMAFPKYSARSVEDIRSSIYHKMLIFTIPIILLVTFYILLAPYIFNTFFPKYADAIVYSQISMLVLLFYQKKLIAYTSLAHSSKKVLYLTSVIPSVLKMILLLILLPIYGIWGAIFTEFALQIFGFFSSFILLRRL